MRAVKNNKEYTIDESQKKAYRDAGFDIYGDGGEVIAFGQGKTVSYELYQQAKAEAEGLSQENKELRAAMEQMLATESLLNQKGEEVGSSESVSEETTEKKESRKKQEKESR